MKRLVFNGRPFYNIFSRSDSVCFFPLSSLIFADIWTPVRARGVVGTWMVPALGDTFWPDVFVLVAKATGASVPVLTFWVAFVVVRLATDRTLSDRHELVKFL